MENNRREPIVCPYATQLQKLCRAWQNKADVVDEMEIIAKAKMLVEMINETQFDMHVEVLYRKIDACISANVLPEEMFNLLTDCKERLRKDYKLRH